MDIPQSHCTYLYRVLVDLSVLIDLALDFALFCIRPGTWVFSELLLEELLISPCSIFCLAGSNEFSKLSACSLKWSANPQNALKAKTSKLNTLCPASFSSSSTLNSGSFCSLGTLSSVKVSAVWVHLSSAKVLFFDCTVFSKSRLEYTTLSKNLLRYTVLSRSLLEYTKFQQEFAWVHWVQQKSAWVHRDFSKSFCSLSSGKMVYCLLTF